MANRITPAILKLHQFLRKWKRELVLCILVSSVFTASWITLREQKIAQGIIDRRSEKELKLNELRTLITQYPDSRDLLFRQTILEWELGNNEEASATIDRARYLDPNNAILPTIKQLLQQSDILAP